MSNVLDLLWDLVERPQERDEYLQDPAGYVQARGRGDLTGEDVIAALDLVRDLVPADLAAAIESRFGGAARAEARGDEAPFDVAIRSLSEVVASVDGHGEAGPRPDPKDINLIPAVTPDAAEPVADTPDREVAAGPGGDVFDPTALEIDADAVPAGDLAEPVPASADGSLFDPDALVVVDGDDGSDAPVDLSWEATPDPGLDRSEDNVFAFEAPRFDDDAAPADDDGADAPEVAPGPMFKKKSNLTLPTIGIDAADWYDEDEPDSDSDA